MGLSQWRRGDITGQQHLGEERETGDRTSISAITTRVAHT
jgi:hypothetical protein